MVITIHCTGKRLLGKILKEKRKNVNVLYLSQIRLL